MPDVVVRPLARSDDRSGFCCGDIELDRFFLRYAGQNQFRHHIGNTYVAVDGERILGFVTVSPGEVAGATVAEHTRKRLPDYPLPILRVSRLAVEHRAQRRGIGKLLLRFTFGLALQSAGSLRLRWRHR
jgi:GNAT superfamily N-acetyltransferase